MAITINGNGTVTGISVGGLPDGIVDTDMLATDAVNNSKLADNAVNSNQIVNGAVGSAELADDSVNEAKISDFYSTNGNTIGGIRILMGSFTSPSSVSDAGSADAYPGARYYFSHTQSISGFASAPIVKFVIASGYHDAFVGGMHETTYTSSQWRQYFSSGRAGGITSVTIKWIAIGDAS